MAGTTLPTPLYPDYRQLFGLSSFLLTAVFAAYALSVLVSLVALGSLSDRIGRRPVLVAAVLLTMASAATFALANSVAALFLGRVLSGVAAGLYVSAASPALIELSPAPDGRRAAVVSAASSVLGLGLGPLLAGLLAQYAPDPLRLAFIVELALAVAVGAGLLAIPESRQRARAGGGGSRRLALPPAGWPVFGRAASAVVGGFALMGLFTALAPSVLVQTMHVADKGVAGLVVFTVFAASGAGQVALRGVPHRHAVVVGELFLAAGVGLVALAASTGSLGVLVVAAAGGGLGQGLVYMGSLSMLAARAPDDRRAAVLSSYFVAAYLGVALPVLGVGLLAGPVGLVGASVAFAAVIATLAALVTADALRPGSHAAWS
jgi:MFS family permease